MDLSFLQSSEITPLLVDLYDSHKLYTMNPDDQPNVRGELTGNIEQLLALNFSAREAELIADVLIELMRQAEKDLREAVSVRIASMQNVPLRFALQMANDDIEVAAPILRDSPVLGDHDLIYIINSKDASYWQAIATRQSLNEAVIDTLVDTGDVETAITMVENDKITLSGHALGVLSDMAQQEERLAQPLIRRDEVDDQLAAALYDYVGETLKASILKEYPAVGDMLTDVVDGTTQSLKGARSQQSSENLSSADHIEAAKNMAERGGLNINVVLETLKRGQYPEFFAQLSVFSGIPTILLTEILQQKSGQGLAILCKAQDIIKTDFISMYLLSAQLRDESSAQGAEGMSKAIEYYERVEPDVARTILNESMKH